MTAMKKVIIDQALYTDVLRINSEYDSFCTVLKCSLIKAHENADLYMCIRASSESESCELYIANNCENIKKFRKDDTTADEWIEAIGGPENVSIFLCHKSALGKVDKVPVSIGVQKLTIPETLCRTMDRLSREDNCVFVIHHEKSYGETEKLAFQKRSVLDLSAIDSSGVDIIYFDGADKLIEKLLYAGCRELTVFITDTNKYKQIIKMLNKLSCKAPFSNRITVVVGDNYVPKTATSILVGDATYSTIETSAHVFYSVNYVDGEGVCVSVGQNTADLITTSTNHHLKTHTIHYITSIMSEIIMRMVSAKEYHSKRLFKVNAKTLVTETIIKED